jgi:hypothetical protein
LIPNAPTVVQIRYPGVKGVLVKKESKNKFLEFRASMVKFKSELNNPFGIIASSVPFEYGALNKQIMMLLAALGVPESIFEKKQEFYYNSVLAIPFSPVDACKWFLTSKKFSKKKFNKFSSGKFSKELINLQQSQFKRSKSDEKSKNRLYIPLLYSR